MKPKVYAHVPYIGTTGYNHHTRDFLRNLSNYLPIKVRNFTVGKTWEWPSDEPHTGEIYLDDLDKSLLYEQTLWNSDNSLEDYKIYTQYGEDFVHNVNLVLCETNHYYFYTDYNGPKIGYNVWESTLQPEHFFNKLKEYDQIWVPSQWQAECTIAQGMPADKVKVVPEGVDVNTFYPEDPVTKLDYVDGRFKFLLFGRWDYRKSTKEIIETFLKEFKPEEPVDLIISIDNPYSGDGLESTENRLKHYNLEDPRIKIKHFPSREDYITYMKNGHVFVSCARSEGWNLPLIEAMACGTPAIYSNCSGQLQFAQHRGLPVKILGEKPANEASYNHFNEIVGNYYEPDFEDLAHVMRNAFENYTDHKKRAIEEAKFIHRDFNWDKVAQIGRDTIQEFLNNYTPTIKPNTINISFIDNPKVEILGDEIKEYLIEFIDKDTNQVVHSSTITNNMWTACSRSYYTNWIIKINGVIEHEFDLTDKRVLITLESKSVGDTVAWAPYVIEFAKKHKCKVILSSFHNEWFEGLDAYKDIEFIPRGGSTSCYAKYQIGWFRDDNNGWKNFSKYPNQVNTIPLQQTATDILGLEYKEVNYGLNFKPKKRPIKEKYICIGPRSTAGCKEWPYHNWSTLAKILNEKGYKVVSVSYEGFDSPNIINLPKLSWEDTYNYLYHAEFFIGLSSGISWFNWGMNKYTFMISGFSSKDHEFQNKVIRIMNENKCNSCWVNPNFSFDAGDWDWCPIWKGTDQQHICQKSITPQQVYESIKNYLKNKS